MTQQITEKSQAEKITNLPFRAFAKPAVAQAGVSFEYFPPQTEEGLENLLTNAGKLAELKPAFQSVTFGTSNGRQSAAYLTARTIEALAVTSVPTVSHLALAHETKSDLRAFLDALVWNGCPGVLALRGDGEIEFPEEAYSGVCDLVSDAKTRHHTSLKSGVGVACYPEPHPLAASPEADLAALKAKQDAGADFAIGQFCFDNEIWFDFVDRARKAGITMPLVPGIMPINDLSNLKSFAARCGANVPDFISEAFDCSNWQNDHDVAAQLLRAQVTELAQGGVEHIHIYTLNKVELSQVAAEAFLEAATEEMDKRERLAV